MERRATSLTPKRRVAESERQYSCGGVTLPLVKGGSGTLSARRTGWVAHCIRVPAHLAVSYAYCTHIEMSTQPPTGMAALSW